MGLGIQPKERRFVLHADLSPVLMASFTKGRPFLAWKRDAHPSTADQAPSSHLNTMAARAAAHTARIHQSRQYTPSPLALSQTTATPNTSPLAANISVSTALPGNITNYNLWYWSIQFPFMLVSPQKIRWLFLAKAVVVPPTWLALLIWAFLKVPPNSGLFAQKATLSGTDLSWVWLGALNSALGSYSTRSQHPRFYCHAYIVFVACTHVRRPKIEIRPE
jgi:hypothetical protein